ncbi:unannotated protein [freshwater metagenome]|uniref:Unannotated protein n=1 Tax=freshwater metagenome TaxID=449393 RepID=A0A6J7LU42_9ZZZZ|nr:hypothetical protein [Actinomycetota bacterium]
MKALLAKIPRDRSLLLLLVPPIAVLAFMVNAQSQANYALPPPVPVGAPAATVPSTVPDLSADAAGAEVDQADVEVAGASVSRTGVTRGTPTGSAGGSRSTGSASPSGGAVPSQVQGASVENPAPTTTVPEDQTGPQPAVSESPLALLLPLSALLMLGVGMFFVLRRRSKPVATKATN